MKTLTVLGLLLFSFSAHAITPFATDGCTHFANGTRAHPTLWRKCCVLHDLAYWAGGDNQALDAVDLKLRDCVAATGQSATAETMYLGVRLGHLAPHGIRGQQWGNAWSETERRTTKLSSSEIDQLQDELILPNYNSILEISDRSAFIQNLRVSN